MTDKLRFGQFISEKRIQHSMTKQELARQIGISTAYLSQLESGARSNPTIEVLDRMINKLHLDEAETHKYMISMQHQMIQLVRTLLHI